jgi:hypothetical protein
MEPDGSLLRLQETSTGPYPDPDESRPYHPNLCLQDQSQYYTPAYVWVLLVVLLLLAFPALTYMHFTIHKLILRYSATGCTNQELR